MEIETPLCPKQLKALPKNMRGNIRTPHGFRQLESPRTVGEQPLSFVAVPCYRSLTLWISESLARDEPYPTSVIPRCHCCPTPISIGRLTSPVQPEYCCNPPRSTANGILHTSIAPARRQVEFHTHCERRIINMAKPTSTDDQILKLLRKIIKMLEEIQLCLDIPSR